MSEPFTATRRIEIDAAHRVPLHGSKCRNVHGHRYVIEAVVSGEELHIEGFQQGMLVDFGFLKEEMVQTIDFTCDHGIILSIHDEEMIKAITGHARNELDGAVTEAVETHGFCQYNKPPFKVFFIEGPPTAEVLAKVWYDMLYLKVWERSQTKARLEELRVWETPNCVATYRPGRPGVGR